MLKRPSKQFYKFQTKKILSEKGFKHPFLKNVQSFII